MRDACSISSICAFWTNYALSKIGPRSGNRVMRNYSETPDVPGNLLAKSLEARGFIKGPFSWRGPNNVEIANCDVNGLDAEHARCPGTKIRDLLVAIDRGARVEINFDFLKGTYTLNW